MTAYDALGPRLLLKFTLNVGASHSVIDLASIYDDIYDDGGYFFLSHYITLFYPGNLSA